MTITHSYRAVPFILILAPKGSVKLLTRLETFAVFSQHSMVIGSVEMEDEVEKAVNKAGAMERKWSQGLIPAKNKNMDMTMKK